MIIKNPGTSFSYIANQKSMIPLIVESPVPHCRIGTVSDGGKHKGKK